MYNLNPLFLLEGRYLDAVVNKQGQTMIDALKRNGIYQKGSELRRQLAQQLRSKITGWNPELDLAHLKANILALEKKIGTTTNPTERSSLVSKLNKMRSILSNSRKYGMRDRVNRFSPTTNYDRMNEYLTGVVKNNTEVTRDVDAGGIGNIFRRMFGRPIKTKQVVDKPGMFKKGEEYYFDSAAFHHPNMFTKSTPNGWQEKWGQDGTEMFHDPKLKFERNVDLFN